MEVITFGKKIQSKTFARSYRVAFIAGDQGIVKRSYFLL